MPQIIKAEISHLQMVAPLFDLYRQFYKAKSDLPAATMFLEERFVHQQSIIFIAIDDENEGIGFVQLYPIFSSVSMKKTWLLNDLFVIEKYRNKKIGYQLLLKAKEFAKLTKAKSLMLETASDNDEAQYLYEKFGFVKSVDLVYYLTI